MREFKSGQVMSHALIAVLSVGLTLTTLWAFPSLQILKRSSLQGAVAPITPTVETTTPPTGDSQEIPIRSFVRGDVITQVDEQAITTAEQLQDLVEQSRINQPLQIKVQRGEQSQQLSVRPGELGEAASQS